MYVQKYFIHYNVTIRTILARNAQSYAVSSALKVSDSQQENRDILKLSLPEKAPSRLTRNICEFQAAHVWSMYYYVTAVL